MQPRTEQLAPSAPDLGLTMTQVLRNPLAALRAAMESFAGEFRADDPRAPTLHAALEQVLAMSRDVEALIDWTKPRPVILSRCRTDEVLHEAVRRLVFEHASRVQVVDGTRGQSFDADAALLGESLHLLLRGLLNAGTGEVLLCANSEGGATTFSIVQQAPGGQRTNDAATSERERLVSLLGSELARRDVERMGGTFAIERTDLGNIRVSVRVPISGPRA
jgi:hypothetical protein